MAYIDHRCAACGHLRSAHLSPANGSPVPCRQNACTCQHYADSSPELIPTFDLKGNTVQTVTPPGEQVTAGIRACDCGACHEMYQQLTGAAA